MKNYMSKVSITDVEAVSCSSELQTKCIRRAIDYCFKIGANEEGD